MYLGPSGGPPKIMSSRESTPWSLPWTRGRPGQLIKRNGLDRKSAVLQTKLCVNFQPKRTDGTCVKVPSERSRHPPPWLQKINFSQFWRKVKNSCFFEKIALCMVSVHFLKNRALYFGIEQS